MKNENSTFKMLAALFLSFKNEREMSAIQLNAMSVACNMLNAVDKDKRLNDGEDYAIVEQIDESENNPFYESNLPEPPKNPLPKKEVIEREQYTIEDSSNVIAEIDLKSLKATVKDNHETLILYGADEHVYGGRIDFKPIPMSEKLKWIEKRLV